MCFLSFGAGLVAFIQHPWGSEVSALALAQTPRPLLALDRSAGILLEQSPADFRPQPPATRRMTTPEPWSILADVAGHLQVSEDTVLRWIAKRKLPGYVS